MTTKKQLREKRKEVIFNVIDTTLMYFCTLIGVGVSKYVPLLREGVPFSINLSLSQLIVTCVVAFMLLTAAEQLGGSNKAGKRRRWLWRAVAAMSYGAFWYNVIGG